MYGRWVAKGWAQINNYNSVFGQTYSFGPHDHTGASGTILSVVKDGRWRTMGETITY